MIDHYNTFDSIENERLKAFNRCQTALIVYQDLGEPATAGYMSQFSDDAKRKMYTIFLEMEEFGEEEVRKQIMKDLH